MPTHTPDSHSWVPPSTPADISDVETYITDLNAVPMEDRDYSLDQENFDHFFGEKSLDYYDTMANTDWFDKEGDLEHVLDNVLGIGWENMRNQHTKQLRDDMTFYGYGVIGPGVRRNPSNRKMHALALRQLFHDAQLVRDDIIQHFKSANSPHVDETLPEYEDDDLLTLELPAFMEHDPASEWTTSDVEPPPSPGHLGLLKAHTNATPPEMASLSLITPRSTPAKTGPPKQTFGGPSPHALDLKSTMAKKGIDLGHTPKKAGPSPVPLLVTPGSPKQPAFAVPPPVPEEKSSGFMSWAGSFFGPSTPPTPTAHPHMYPMGLPSAPPSTSPLPPGAFATPPPMPSMGPAIPPMLPNTPVVHVHAPHSYYTIPTQLYIPRKYQTRANELSWASKAKMYDNLVRKQRPLANIKPEKTKNIGDFVVVEQTGSRFHVEIKNRLPSKTLHRLATLIWIHAQKFPDCILNQLVNGSEKSWGSIKSIGKKKLVQILKQAGDSGTFVIQSSPAGGSLNAPLTSDFWTQPKLANILARKTF